MDGSPEIGRSLVRVDDGLRIELTVPAWSAELGWRALLVAGSAVADEDRIVEIAVSGPDPADRQLSRFHPPGRRMLPHPRLGTVTVDEACAQLARNRFALEAHVRVSRIEAIGAAIDGLATGLVGGDSAVIEGLATCIVDDEGRRVHRFHATRLGTGIGSDDPAFGREAAWPVEAQFPNLTGGPRTSYSARAL
jgi:hypothetical protein